MRQSWLRTQVVRLSSTGDRHTQTHTANVVDRESAPVHVANQGTSSFPSAPLTLSGHRIENHTHKDLKTPSACYSGGVPGM
jgi:hypothetical protein